MKHKIRHFLLLCALLSPVASFAQPETLTLDPQHTYLLWHVKHLGFSTQAGKWYARGTLTVDEKKPQDSKVNVIVQVANLITGDPELDRHLKGDLFFDVAKYPTATFVSNKVVMTGKQSAKVYGVLTLHGVSKPIVLNVKLNLAGENPVTGKMTAGFSGTTTIKRSDFGINAFLPAVGDDVDINIEAEAYK